jgi:hypothetical protein
MALQRSNCTHRSQWHRVPGRCGRSSLPRAQRNDVKTQSFGGLLGFLSPGCVMSWIWAVASSPARLQAAHAPIRVCPQQAVCGHKGQRAGADAVACREWPWPAEGATVSVARAALMQRPVSPRPLTQTHLTFSSSCAAQVAVQQLPLQGRGLVARQRLSKGELLIQAPMSLVLSDTSVLTGACPAHP